MKKLGNPPPGIQPSGSRCAARRRVGSRRTVLGGKGSLRRGKPHRALASSAPFCMKDDSRRTAPPGTRCNAISSSYERREPGCS
jgi:hypothetical protein